MTKKLFSGIMLFSLLFFGCCIRITIKPLLFLEPSGIKWAAEKLAELSLEEKIGQMIAVRYRGAFQNNNSDYIQKIKNHIRMDKIGGLILVGGEIYATAVLTNSLQDLADIPLLIASDLERGLGNQLTGATLFPPVMALGAAGSEELAYEMGKITAVEARAVGIHMTYAPVVDVNNNPNNPIINVRSFGEDPKEVGRLASAFIRGCQNNGLIATAKHFPGHGDTDLDSHSVLPVIKANRERLDRIELLPFKQAVAAGVMAVMTAHLRLPALDDTPDLPATLSRPILTDLLQHELGFSGLIVTDAMEMGGITSLYSDEEAALKAIQAGADMVLLPPRPRDVLKSLVAAVRQEKISEKRIDVSVKKILEIKARLGLHRDRSVSLEQPSRIIASTLHLKQAKSVFEKSLTLVKNKDQVLPILSRKTRITVFSLSSDAGDYFAGRHFINEVKKRSDSVFSVFAEPSTGIGSLWEAKRKALESEVVIFALFSRLSAWKGKVDLNLWHTQLIVDLIRENVPVIAISFGSPYFLKHFSAVDAYICAYRFAGPAQAAAAAAIFGEIGFFGRLPVSIPGIFPAGHGIRLLPRKY